MAIYIYLGIVYLGIAIILYRLNVWNLSDEVNPSEFAILVTLSAVIWPLSILTLGVFSLCR